MTQSVCADFRNSFRYCLAMPHPNQHVLHYVKTDERDAEQKRFVQNRINEWLVIQPLAKMQVFGNEQDLGKYQCIDVARP